MTTPTLLGYLARFGSFSAQSEVLCTQGLTYLLQEYEDARSALATEVAARGGHIWIPLKIPLEASHEQMVEALVEQAQAVERVAYAAT